MAQAVAPGERCLEAEFSHEVVVRFGVFAFEVFHQAPPFADFLDQPAARRVVFLVRLQVLDELAHFRTQERDLDLRRTRVIRVGLEFFDDFLLLALFEHRNGGFAMKR